MDTGSHVWLSGRGGMAAFALQESRDVRRQSFKRSLDVLENPIKGQKMLTSKANVFQANEPVN